MTKQMTLMARTHSFEGSHMPVYSCSTDVPVAWHTSWCQRTHSTLNGYLSDSN